MDIVRICGLAVICSVVGALVGKITGSMSTAVRLGGTVLVLGGVVVILSDVTRRIGSVALGEEVALYTAVMLKGLGVATLCRICADICRDCGENTVASAVETAGKLGMVLIALPLVEELLEYAEGLLERI